MKCYHCGQRIRKDPALILPPVDRGKQEVWHLCRKCWKQLMEIFFV